MENTPGISGGEFAGRYTIERELGRGGAAVVYLARDVPQERNVAVKMLHRELGQAIGAKRFLREIKHASSLQHPHLLSILESGEADGVLYYVMPYMQDGSLRARIAREKQLPIDEALRITRHVGEALDYAHSSGIVHRDIKPDNVLFSANHACLADFGIARAVDSVAADTLTSTGLVVGTPAYMSPEQASGEKRVDARSDQYSLACLLYEMVTGLPPFIGATQQAVISQRFTQPPPSIRAHRPTVPDHVERAVKRALSVVPADRFASVADFIAALHDPTAESAPVSTHAIRRRWFAVGAAAAVVTLAVMAAGPGADWARGAFGTQLDTAQFVVLPFLSDDPSRGAAVANQLRAELRTWEGLGLEDEVAVREAVQDAGGSVGSLRESIAIARKLGAGRLVWGTVTADGDRIRVMAQLYDVRTSTVIAERVDVSEGDAPADSGVRMLANSLIAFEALPETVDDGFAGTRSYPALLAYRGGVSAMSRLALEAARAELSKAVDADPDFGVAHLELARVDSWLNPNETASGVANARRAVALRGELRPRDATRAEALLAHAEGDFPTACSRYRTLIAADSLDAYSWFGIGECLHSDDIVIRDSRSRSGFSFRSSWHSAGAAFLRALDIEPALHRIPHFRRLGRLFPTGHNQIRTGQALGADPAEFGAPPQLVADTLAYTPYPLRNFDSRDARAGAARLRALERNRQILLELASAWTRTYPRSSDAHAAVGAVLEVRGDFDRAVKSLVTARRLARSPVENLLLADAEARVRLKAADFSGAQRTADSALSAVREVTNDNWEVVARLAGLTGKSSRLAAALEHFWPGYAHAGNLHQSVSRAAGEALAHAVLSVCTARPDVVQARLAELIGIHVQPDRQANITEHVIGPVASFSVPCASGRVPSQVHGPHPVDRAQRAFAAGDSRLARSILDSAARSRSYLRAADVSPHLITREAAMLLALGDTARAADKIDETLRGLPGASASLLRYPVEYAILVRMMATRAEIAAAAGDSGEARKWAQAVAILWAKADRALHPTVARMHRIVQSSRR